ncbi:MAG: WXG100 family type VII secretion target [Clostridiaceae bacterium]|jgi:WXG100 family type VII secretion target|nr:WXG100 family type VII secretion target [Clostridiaceae bacterium]
MPDFRSTDVDSRQIENTAASLDEDIKALSSVCTFIRNDVMANLDPYWEGQAKQSFEQRFTRFAEALVKLVDEYRVLNDLLKRAGDTYGKADDSVRNTIAKLPR